MTKKVTIQSLWKTDAKGGLFVLALDFDRSPLLDDDRPADRQPNTDAFAAGMPAAIEPGEQVRQIGWIDHSLIGDFKGMTHRKITCLDVDRRIDRTVIGGIFNHIGQTLNQPITIDCQG